MGDAPAAPDAHCGPGSLTARLGLWVRATRPFSFPCSVMPLLVATAAAAPVSRWRWDALATVLLSVLSMHVAGNVLNDYFDFVSGVDSRTDGEEGRPGRLLVSGAMRPRQAARGALLALAVSLAAAGYLAWRVDALALAFWAVGLLGAYAYTGPPFNLKARALGEPTMLVFFGPALMAGAAYVQVERIPLPVLLLSVPMGLSVSHILVGNNLRDMEEDAAGGVRTLAHVVGARAMVGLYCALALALPLGIAAVGLAYDAPLLALTPVSWLAVIGPARALLAGRRPADIDARTARFMAGLGATATLTLVASGGL
jgi:1,4-dihydroxy-2-naphthoate octaprenyltransferase